MKQAKQIYEVDYRTQTYIDIDRYTKNFNFNTDYLKPNLIIVIIIK